MKLKILLFVGAFGLGLVLFYAFFDDIMCGKINSKLEDKIQDVNSQFGERLKAKNIPCESRYIKVVIKANCIPSTTLDSVHAILYDEKTNYGWPTIMVYDSDMKYLYSHSFKNKIYRQEGE